MHTDAGGHDAAVAAIEALRGAGHRVYLHTRGPQSPDLRDQLLATLRDGVYGVSLPGVVHADQLRFADSLLEDVEGRAGIEPGLTALGLWIENAAALGRVGALAAGSSRLTWLGVATAPLAMELAVDAPAPALLDHARAAVVFAARASGLPAVEGLPLPAVPPTTPPCARTACAAGSRAIRRRWRGSTPPSRRGEGSPSSRDEGPPDAFPEARTPPDRYPAAP